MRWELCFEVRQRAEEDAYSQARLLFYRSRVFKAMDEQTLAIKDVETALAICRSGLRS